MHNFREIFILSLIVAGCLTPLMRIVSFRLGILDHPKKHGIHTHPVPRIGGVAIYFAFVIGALWHMDLSHMLKGVLVGSTIIFVMGIVDDKIYLRASIKLAIQILACCIMMFRYGVILEIFPNLYLNAFFTAFGIIGITNAVNFLDNMDGLSSGLVMISSAAIFMVAFSTGQIWLGYLSMAMIGATGGFLIFNLRKSYIFMGDAGSTFLGFTLSSLAVMTEWSRDWPVTIATPLLILAVPIIDMTLITVLRIKEDKVSNLTEWIDYAGKDHLSHRVMRLGLGYRGAVFVLWGVQSVFCLIALYLLPRGFYSGLVGLAFFFLMTVGIVFFFRRRRSILLRWNGRIRAKTPLSESVSSR